MKSTFQLSFRIGDPEVEFHETMDVMAYTMKESIELAEKKLYKLYNIEPLVCTNAYLLKEPFLKAGMEQILA